MWIKKLQSGTTRKAKGQLFKSNRACCLGVALSECNLDKKSDFIKAKSLLDTRILKFLNLRNEDGKIISERVKPKWRKLLSTMVKDGNTVYSLAWINDKTTMSHVDIGNFINENREAVFLTP